MPKCSVCGTSKIFLKLTNGLCANCKDLFDTCEDKYKTLLRNTTDPNSNKDELVLSILSLSVDVRKFENTNISSITANDCDALLEIVKAMNPSINVSTVDNKVKITHSIDNPLSKKKALSITNNNETFSSPSAYDDSKVTFNSNVTLPSSSESISISNTIPNSDILTLPNASLDFEASNEEPVENVIDIKNHLISDFNEEDIELSQDVSTESPVEISVDPTVSSSSSFSISSSEKSEILGFLDILNDNFISVDEKAYALFTLKEKYLDLCDLKTLNSFFEVDFNTIYDESLRKLSISLSCPKDKVYSLYNYVAFSIQTTGIKINSNSIIELAGVRVRYGQIEDTFHSLVNPLQTISLSTEDKTKLSNSSLASAPTLDLVLQEFVKFCNNLDLVTHNSNFNYKFLDTYSQKLFRKPLGINNVCTVKLYRTRYKQFHGEPTKDCSLLACCTDLLEKEDLNLIENTSSIALSETLGTYKLYEIIKTKYK